MFFLPDLRERCREPEVMDDPGLDECLHVAALRSLERINWVSGSAGILWPPLGRLANTVHDGRLRILDIATGAGDLPLALWRRAQRAGVALSIDGCDVSERALEHARHRSAQAGAPIDFFRLDVLADEIPEGYDVILCSLFLHHLETPDAKLLLEKMARAAHRLVLLSDLARGPICLGCVHLVVRFLSWSPVVHIDGPRSVRAAFTRNEMAALAREAGMANAEVKARPPCRFLLEWHRR